MKLVAATDEAVTVRFERREFGAIRAIVHSATIEYDDRAADIHNLSLEQLQKLDDDLDALC